MASPKGTDLSDIARKLSRLPKAGDLARVATQQVLARAERFDMFTSEDSGFTERVAQEAEVEQKELPQLFTKALAALENGPKSQQEANLAGALLALGIQGRLEAAGSPEALRSVIDGFIDQLDWLSATSTFSPYLALTSILEPQLREDFWKAVASSFSRDAQAAADGEAVNEAGKHLLLLSRASSLSHMPELLKPNVSDSLKADLESGELKRVALAALAGVDDLDVDRSSIPGIEDTVSSRATAAARAPKLDGLLEPRQWGLIATTLAAITGVLLVRWLLKLGARYLLGLRHEGSINLRPTTLVVDGELHLLGKVVREQHATRSLNALEYATVENRFRYLHLIIGAAALVIGAALGINFLVEGAVASYPPLALFGVAVIASGILLDVALELLIPNKQGVSTLTLDFGKRQVFRLRKVERKKALQFVDEVENLLPGPRKTKSSSSK